MASNRNGNVAEYQRSHDEDGRAIHGLNIILFGDYGVGKTSLTTKFIDDCFYSTSCYHRVDFRIKAVTVDNTPRKLLVWDLVGLDFAFERFQMFPSSYLSQRTAALLMFDITSLKSFKYLKVWMELFHISGCFHHHIYHNEQLLF